MHARSDLHPLPCGNAREVARVGRPTPKCQTSTSDGRQAIYQQNILSGRRESNPHGQLGRSGSDQGRDQH
jgi:hypothetical protein